MKKIVATLMAALCLCFTGCTPSEATLVKAANTAGYIGLLTWFSIDNPTPEVKSTLKEVVTIVDEASISVSEGNTYLDSLLPYIQEFVAKQEGLTPVQKELINAGSVVILNGIDAFLDANPKVKKDSELVGKIVSAFCSGCLKALSLPEDCPECTRARGVYLKRNAKYSREANKFIPAE